MDDIMPQPVLQVRDYYEINVMKKNWKCSSQFAALILSAFICFNPVSAQQSGTSGSSSSGPLDLTILPTLDEDTETTAEETPAAETTGETTQQPGQTPAVTLSIRGLNQQNSSSIRLASLGISLPPEDNLDRMMWQGSDAATALDLYRRLPAELAVPALRQQLARVALMRTVPPEGSIDVAAELIQERLKWLVANVGGDNLAEIVRQLPDGPDWEGWHQWLVLHDLVTRNDEEACRLAEWRATQTLEIIWHKVNAFCMFVAGDVEKASFALDILKDRGVTAPIYFTLMRQLIDGAPAGATAGAPAGAIDQSGADVLDLVLLDSARVNITMAAIRPIDRFDFSLSGLHNLENDAAALIAARTIRHDNRPAEDILAIWSLQPAVDIPASEAFSKFSLADEDDDIAIARYQTWKALSQETDKSSAAQLALEALKIDFRHIGPRSLGVWVPFIVEGGLNAGPLPGLISGIERDGLTDQALAWSDILAFPEEQLGGQTIVRAGALDAVPLMQAMGMAIEDLDWTSHFEQTERLAENATSLPLARLEVIEAAAIAGRRAELVMLAAISIGGKPLHHLSRDDAAHLVGVFIAAGMEKTARLLAADIMRGWVADRYFRTTGETDAASG